jgi:hypothetical protein
MSGNAAIFDSFSTLLPLEDGYNSMQELPYSESDGTETIILCTYVHHVWCASFYVRMFMVQR